VNVEGLIEKPHPSVAPSNLAIAGRYVLTPAVFDMIREQPRGSGGEIQLTDGISAMLATEQVLAYRYHGERYDCGSKLGLMQASVVLAEIHPELGGEFSAWLRERQKTRRAGGGAAALGDTTGGPDQQADPRGQRVELGTGRHRRRPWTTATRSKHTSAIRSPPAPTSMTAARRAS
jgi:hypothetical protein